MLSMDGPSSLRSVIRIAAPNSRFAAQNMSIELAFIDMFCRHVDQDDRSLQKALLHAVST